MTVHRDLIDAISDLKAVAQASSGELGSAESSGIANHLESARVGLNNCYTGFPPTAHVYVALDSAPSATVSYNLQLVKEV